MKRTTLLLIQLLMIFSILSGCKLTSPTMTTAQSLQPNYPHDAKEYLVKAMNAESPQRELYTLQAVGNLIKDGSYERAAQLLKAVDGQVDENVQTEKLILNAYLFNSTHQPKKTLSTLAQINGIEKLPADRQAFYYDLLAYAYQENNSPYQSIAERIKLSHVLMNTANRQWNTKLIWQLLQRQDINSLDAARVEHEEPELKAWVELAYIFKKHQTESSQLHQSIASWRQQYPHHLANEVLPKETLTDMIDSSPEHIALFLPSKGRYAKAANAIRDGFMAGYFHAREQGSNVSIKIYDTSNKNINHLYQMAIADGANFIVGPLNKKDVIDISQQTLNVPTLALNYVEQQRKPIANLYQFGISPQDEALQAAIKAYQDGARKALVLVPEGSWGKNIADTFQQEWTNLGGTVVGELNYQTRSHLNTDIKNLFFITDSYKRKRQIENCVHKKVKFFPRRRQDVDMIYLVANPQHARQIRPMLKFYYAGQIPVYSNSSIYTYSKHGNKDIEGIYFCDIPWLIDKKLSAVANQRFSAFTNYRKNHDARLYAMGYDALEIAMRLHQLHTFPNIGIEGATGRLYLDSLGKVRRELLWAEFKHDTIKQVGA